MFHVRTHVQGQRHAGVHQTFPALDGEGARVFYEVYPGFQMVGRDFQNFRASFSFRHPLKSSRQRKRGPWMPASSAVPGRRPDWRWPLIFPALNPLDSHDANGGGADAGGKRGVAFRNVKTVKQADAPRACFSVRSGALPRRGRPKAEGGLSERVQFFLQGGVSQFRPRLDAAVPAFIRFNKGSLPAHFRGSGVQRAAGC